MAVSRIDSQTISLLRFPLALLVVFCHMNPNTTALADTNFGLLSPIGIINTIEIILSYVIGHTAVPGFFLISGFLYFNGLQTWNWKAYLVKTKNRIHSLLVPYLVWNFLSILTFILLYIYIGIKHNNFQQIQTYISSIDISSFWNCNIWGLQKADWLGNPTPSSGPHVVTLWFLRDLISVSVFSPIIFFLLKKAKLLGLIFLLICYISKIWIQIPGFSIDACFFFGTGAYIAIHNYSLEAVSKKNQWVFYIFALLSFPICTYYGGLKEHLGSLVFPIWAIAFVGTYINWVRILAEKKTIAASPILIQGCMFVYALHALPIAKLGSPLSWIGYKLSLFFRPIPGHELITYIFTPIVTTCICIVIFYTIRNISPYTCKILTGKTLKK